MRTPLVLAGVLLASPAEAQDARQFSFRRDLQPGARIHVANVIGNVRVEAASGRTFEATAVKRAGRYGDPEDVEVRTVDLPDGVALCVVYPANRRAWDDERPSRERNENRNSSENRNRNDDRDNDPCRRDNNWSDGHSRNDTEVDFTLKVPSGMRLRAGTVSGDVDGERLSGDLELRSVSGDVRLTGGEGPRISLETVSGSVDLLQIRAREVEGHTVSGRVTFEGPVQDGGSYDFATTSGSISLSLPQQPNATLSAATFSGRFSSDFPTTTDDRRRRRTRHSAVWGNGSARVDVESLSGNITIRTTAEAR